VAHTLDRKDSLFSFCLEESTAVFKLGFEAIETGQDLEVEEELLDLLKEAEESKHVDAILMLHNPEDLSEERYGAFLTKARGGGLADRAANSGWYERDLTLARGENGLNQIINAIHGSRKLTVAGLQGSITEPFFGAALAFDFRYASEGTVFLPSHARFGLPPCGALGYFLPRFVGLGKATSIMLDPQPIPADVAQDLGLVSEVLPADGFGAGCIERVQRIPNPLSATLLGAKELLSSHNASEWGEYLARESVVLRKYGLS
jgi:enoyl-CoA hydratase/carnithine racemase